MKHDVHSPVTQTWPARASPSASPVSEWSYVREPRTWALGTHEEDRDTRLPPERVLLTGCCSGMNCERREAGRSPGALPAIWGFEGDC